MKTSKCSRRVMLRLEELEPRLAPAVTLETFDKTPVGTLPAGWSQWSSTGGNAFAVSSSVALSPPNSLAVSSGTASGLNARSWINTAQPADEQGLPSHGSSPGLRRRTGPTPVPRIE